MSRGKTLPIVGKQNGPLFQSLENFGLLFPIVGTFFTNFSNRWKSPFNGIRIRNDTAGAISNIRLTRSVVRGSGQEGILLDPREGPITSLWIEGLSLRDSQNQGIFFRVNNVIENVSLSRSLISGNNQQGIQINLFDNGLIRNTAIRSNQLAGNARNPFQFIGTTDGASLRNIWLPLFLCPSFTLFHLFQIRLRSARWTERDRIGNVLA